MADAGISVRQLAEEILERTGGKENLTSVAYCMTRLRLALADWGKVDRDAVKQIAGVMGVVEQGDQFQVVLGPGRVVKVAGAIATITGLTVGELDEAEVRKSEIKARNATPFNQLLKKIANIFIPLIPAFIACGLVLGLNNILVKADPAVAGTTVGGILSLIGNAVFYGLNLFVGVNAAKEFGGSPALGGVLAAVITNPAMAQVQIAGQALVPGRGGIIAVLLVVALGCWLERQIRKNLPEVLDLFVTPLLTIIISGFVAIYFLQPLGGIISDSIAAAVRTALVTGGALTGFVLTGAFLPLVMTGLHQGLTPIHAELLKTSGENLLLPVLAIAGAGQVGAALAVLVKTKSKRLQRTILSGLPIGILGVGEPLIYGVTLPLGKPFVAACIGGACGGAYVSMLKVASISMGLSGIPLAALIKPGSVVHYLIGIVIAYTAGFVTAYLLGFEDPQE